MLVEAHIRHTVDGRDDATVGEALHELRARRHACSSSPPSSEVSEGGAMGAALKEADALLSGREGTLVGLKGVTARVDPHWPLGPMLDILAIEAQVGHTRREQGGEEGKDSEPEQASIHTRPILPSSTLPPPPVYICPQALVSCLTSLPARWIPSHPDFARLFRRPTFRPYLAAQQEASPDAALCIWLRAEELRLEVRLSYYLYIYKPAQPHAVF